MENKNKYIYILISQTHTRFAYVIRKIGRVRYNHAAIALDADLSRLYSFSRPQHNAIFMGKLVRESLERYTLQTDNLVPVVVFRVPVSEVDYKWIESIIQMVQNDSKYMYNLLSVLSYPITKGFATYKAFSCIEFVIFLLNCLGFPLSKPGYRYKPDDLLEILSNDIIYKGDVRDCMVQSNGDSTYFAPMTTRGLIDNFKAFCVIISRTIIGLVH